MELDKDFKRQLLLMDAGPERVRYWERLLREQQAARDKPKADQMTGMQPGRIKL